MAQKIRSFYVDPRKLAADAQAQRTFFPEAAVDQFGKNG
jgi:hypothetical protein